MATEPLAPPAAGRQWGEVILGAATVLFGAAVIWQTFQIRITPAYSTVGPRAVPLIVGFGLVIVGIWLTFEAVTGRVATPSRESEDADPALPTDWRAVGLLAVALALYLFLIVPAGFIIASAILFTGGAFAMGSTRLIRDICLGVVLAAGLYVAFTAGLGLRLPAGILGGLF